MTSPTATHPRFEIGLSGALAASVAVCLGVVLGGSPAMAQGFSSGSDGSDGAFAPPSSPAVVVFDPSQFQGTGVASNVFNFTTVNIPQGVTVRFSGSVLNGPVYWLVQGDVVIDGVLDLSGGGGASQTNNASQRVPSIPGSGGFGGGVGGYFSPSNSVAQAAHPGGGTGGGTAGECSAQQHGGGAAFGGNQFLVPLVGGSGGGGGVWCSSPTFGGGGGAGGGAILIASSTTIRVGGTGVINANGGSYGGDQGGSGSGGAIRLVSNSISVHIPFGTLTAQRGFGPVPQSHGQDGVIRLEAFSVSTGGVLGRMYQSSPFPLYVPSAAATLARVISIGGVAVSPNPSVFPDITVNTAAAIPVVIQTQNVPTTAVVRLTVLNQNGVPDTVYDTPPLGNCTGANNVCETTVMVTFPYGASRGLTKVTWTQ